MCARSSEALSSEPEPRALHQPPVAGATHQESHGDHEAQKPARTFFRRYVSSIFGPPGEAIINVIITKAARRTCMRGKCAVYLLSLHTKLRLTIIGLQTCHSRRVCFVFLGSSVYGSVH